MTRLVLTTEQHFLRAPGGGVHVVGSEAYDFFARYLQVFERVTVLSRVRDAEELPRSARRADGEGVRFYDLPDFHGASGTLVGALPAARAVARAVDAHRGELFMLRPPGPVSLLTYAALERRRAPFAVELVTDPAETFRASAFGSPLLSLLRRPLAGAFARMCRRALAVSYVTERHLQARYPARAPELGRACPDGDLPADLFERHAPVRARLERSELRLERARLFLTGRMDRPFKGIDVALRALAALRARGREVSLEIAGGGRLFEEYRALASRLGVADAVEWLGEVSDHAALLEALEESDIFVLPTRREGLPRALLEAMALGLPCLATPIAGIPELLDREDLVPVDDPAALASAIDAMAGDKAWRLRASARNHERARQFGESGLATRRVDFHRLALGAFEGSGE